MIKIWNEQIPGYQVGHEEPTLEAFILEKESPHGVIIVCAGGGYRKRAAHEGKDVAKWLNTIGLSAFVLNYRVAPTRHPYPLMDAQRAIRYVRYYAKNWNIDPNKIGIMGFSAGGHLAACTSIFSDEGDKESTDVIEQVSSKVNTTILCYPVISFQEHAHLGSVESLLGSNPKQELLHILSLQNSVTMKNPPTFLWHTADDQSVPVENSLMFAEALRKNSVPYELHIFPHGRHGLGLALQNKHVSVWTKLCENWLEEIGFVKW